MLHASTFGRAIDPNAIDIPLTARTRDNLAALVRWGQISGDTGRLHGPREYLPADRRDCGCGWGDLCDAPPHGICACTPYRNIGRQDWRRIVDSAR